LNGSADRLARRERRLSGEVKEVSEMAALSLEQLAEFKKYHLRQFYAPSELRPPATCPLAKRSMQEKSISMKSAHSETIGDFFNAQAS
jgi:hypothetical protein